MLYVRIIVGIALAAHGRLRPGRRVSPDHQSQSRPACMPARRHVDHRRAAVLILRILAAMLGFWLLFFSIVQLLHGHGQLPH